jgi:hypothetical protein
MGRINDYYVGSSESKCASSKIILFKFLKVSNMFTEEQFLEKVKTVHGNDIEVIGRFKGTTKPIIFKTKYGICQYPTARQLYDKKIKPTIKCALNKTEYFMAMLSEKYPEIAESLNP